MRRRVGVFVFLFLCVLPVLAESLRVNILVAPKQRNAYHQAFRQFTEETGIEIAVEAYVDSDYKQHLDAWLHQDPAPDVLYWQASHRLYHYVQQDLIHPLTTLWKRQGWDDAFAKVKSNVAYQGEIYGLPLSYYHWGIFYNKAVVESLGGEPKTWAEFIALCEGMKQAGIDPIGIDSNSQWPVLAWFDYLNLRINGLAFHQQLLLGQQSFLDPRVLRVFNEWKGLIHSGFFRATEEGESWDSLLPYLYRKKLGMMLIGNFASVKLPSSSISTIGFMPFPQIEPLPRYEDAPIDLLMIPKGAKHLANAEKLLVFMAQAEVQASFNADLGYLPPNRQAVVTSGDPYIQAGAELLRSAEGFAQFFDRDTLPAFEQQALPIISYFVQRPNVDKTVQQLEALRLQLLTVSPPNSQ